MTGSLLRTQLAHTTLCAGLSLIGCTGGGDPSSQTPEQPDSGRSVVDAGLAPTVRVTPDPLIVALGEPTSVTVAITPSDCYQLRYGLTGSGSQAFLTKVTERAATGSAEVQVTVPTAEEVRLRVYAQACDKPDAPTGFVEVPVDVKERPKATIRAELLYEGERPVSEWVVRVDRNLNCDSPDSAYDEGLAFPGSQAAELIVKDVDAQRRVAVFVRGDRYIYGCRELDAEELLPSPDIQVVRVPVLDRQLQLDELDLPLYFHLDPVEQLPELGNQLEALISDLLVRFRDGVPNDPQALLNAMSAQAVDPSRFELARRDHGWEQAIIDYLSARAGFPTEMLLSEQLQGWLRRGAEALSEDRVFQGRLRSSGGTARLELSSVGELTPAETAFSLTVSTTLNADPVSDRLRAGFELRWDPVRFISRFAVARADSNPQVGLVPELNELADCRSLAASLVQTGSMEECGPGCMEVLCTGALGAMWERVELAQQEGAYSLSVNAAGPAELGGQPIPLSFAGRWAGEVRAAQTGSPPAQVAGTFTTKRPE